MNYIIKSRILTFLLFSFIFAAVPSFLNIINSDDPNFFMNYLFSSFWVGLIVFVVLRKRFD